jgi:hypothetical protein
MQALPILEDPMTVDWDDVTPAEVVRATQEYDRLGAEKFFSEHGFAPTTTYDLVWEERRYPPKAILGTAYELATGQRLGSSDFEGGKTGAVRVLGTLGFTIRPPATTRQLEQTRTSPTTPCPLTDPRLTVSADGQPDGCALYCLPAVS